MKLKAIVEFKNTEYIIAGKSNYINDQFLCMIQPYENYKINGLYFPACIWVNEKHLKFIRYEDENKKNKKK